MLLILAVQVRENSYLLLVIHSEHANRKSENSTVLMEYLQDAAISILTFQGYLNDQNKLILKF